MKKSILLIVFVLFAALLLAGCAPRARVGALQTESQSVELGDARSVRVEIDFGGHHQIVDRHVLAHRVHQALGIRMAAPARPIADARNVIPVEMRGIGAGSADDESCLRAGDAPMRFAHDARDERVFAEGLARAGADYLVFRGGRATVGPLVLGSQELRDLRGRVDTAVYTSSRREVSLRDGELKGALRLVDAILESRQAA